MESRKIGDIRLIFESGEDDTADLIAETCEKAIQLAREDWGFGPPEDCHIYVMTSPLRFIFQSATLSWKIMLVATMPFWLARVSRTWHYSAAWTQRYGRRTAIGVKPARLIEQSDRSIGLRMFVEETDVAVNVQHVTCHELVHACSAHLRLPMWLNEGIATATVDRFLGRQTIRQDTLQYMKDYLPKKAPPTYRELSRMDGEAIAYHGMRGYWLVRYLEDKHPGFLKGLFSQGKDSKTIERDIAAELGVEVDSYWLNIDKIVTDYFINGE